MARSKTATAEAIFWQAIEAFALQARTTSLDPRSRPENVALIRTNRKTFGVGAAYFTKLFYFLKRARLRRTQCPLWVKSRHSRHTKSCRPYRRKRMLIAFTLFDRSKCPSLKGFQMANGCSHLKYIRNVTPSALGCEECLETGDKWSIYVCVVRAATLGAVTILPIATRRSTFTQPDTLLSKATIRPRDGAGATLTKSRSIFRVA